MPNKVNKGEWAELFVFLKALSVGKIHAADENLNKVEQLFYVILSAIKMEHGNRREYLIQHDEANVVLYENNVEQAKIPLTQFVSFSETVLTAIKEGTGTFEIPDVEPFLNQLKISQIKANSDSKKDIVFKIHDDFTGAEPEIGFSIKSYVGSKPTLLNASGATKIQYQLSSSLPKTVVAEINSIGGKSKIKDRISALSKKSIQLEFEQLPNAIFHRNLQLIDYRMPELLANLFLTSYFVKGKSIQDVVKLFCLEYDEDEELVSYKIKDLLVAIALGMEPNTKWTGLEDANGGYIVVKEDGEILCYHIYDRNKLKEYLYRHTKFDSPSSGRTGAGLIFEENSVQKFSLTVQIRF